MAMNSPRWTQVDGLHRELPLGEQLVVVGQPGVLKPMNARSSGVAHCGGSGSRVVHSAGGQHVEPGGAGQEAAVPHRIGFTRVLVPKASDTCEAISASRAGIVSLVPSARASGLIAVDGGCDAGALSRSTLMMPSRCLTYLDGRIGVGHHLLAPRAVGLARKARTAWLLL